MVIGTFTSGETTQIGYKSLILRQYRTIDSKILYQNPELFKDRFLSILNNLFGFNSVRVSNFQLVFSISGIIDEEQKEIIFSKIINDISFSNYFNGFSFVKTFAGLIDAKNIHLISPSNCTAFGQVLESKRKINFPALSIFIDKEVGVSLIKNRSIVENNSILSPMKTLDNKTVNDLLCDKGIEEILRSGDKNISEKYSLSLVEVINNIFLQYRKDDIVIKNVFIHSYKDELINRSFVREKIPKINFTFTDSRWKNFYLPIKGTINILRSSKFRVTGISTFTTIFLSLILGIIISNFISISSPTNLIFGDIFYVPIVVLITLFLGFLSFAILSSTSAKLGAKGYLPSKFYYISKIFNLIKHITYTSDNGVITINFENFSKFVKHWEKTKPIATGENYYTIHYIDDTRLRVFLEDLNSITDLQKYRHWLKDKTSDEILEMR